MKPRSDAFVKPRNADGKVWRGPHMSIHSFPGTKIIFHGAFKAQISWGGCDDPSRLLRLDKEYELEFADIHGSYTTVKLVGVEGMFPSGAFHHVGAAGWVEEE